MSIFAMFSNWSLYSVKPRPSILNSSIISSSSNSIIPQPLKESFGNVINSDVDIVPFIISLGHVISPYAILRGISLVIINSFDSRFREWFFSHIGIKQFKRVPPITDSYSSLTIIMEGCMVGVITALTHILPRSVLWAIRHPMCDTSIPRKFFHETPTAFCMSTVKTVNYYFAGVPAITKTIPICSAMGFVRFAQDEKPTISFSSEVLIIFSHEGIMPQTYGITIAGWW